MDMRTDAMKVGHKPWVTVTRHLLVLWSCHLGLRDCSCRSTAARCCSLNCLCSAAKGEQCDTTCRRMLAAAFPPLQARCGHVHRAVALRAASLSQRYHLQWARQHALRLCHKLEPEPAQLPAAAVSCFHAHAALERCTCQRCAATS